MKFIAEYTTFIEKKLKDVHFPQTPAQLYDPIRYFMSIGGKRIRPILTLLGGEMFGVSNKQTINCALAIEIFHNFTLLHDDIMDEAPLRRNMKTVHEKWNPNTAILSGDVLLVKAYELLQEQKEGDLRTLLKIFNKTAVEVCEGQQLDLDFEKCENISINEYQEMIRLKTSVLLACALEMSAVIAKTNEQNQQHISNFGINIGLAFQIMDDLLDLYADPDKFGKQIGGDIIANKKTMLHIIAIEQANTQQKEQIESLKHETNQTKKIAETRNIYDQLNVKQLVTEKINTFFELSQIELQQINVPKENKEKLFQLSNFLLYRNS